MQWTVDEFPGPSFTPLLRVTVHLGSGRCQILLPHSLNSRWLGHVRGQVDP
jgi:hypothetical protein